MLRKLLITLGLSLTILSSPAAALNQVQGGYWVDGFQWQRGGTGRITIVFQLVNESGKISICGSYLMTGPLNTKKLSREVIASYKIKVGGRILVHNVTFFRSVRSEDELGREYECYTTNVDWFAGANDNVETEMYKF